MIPGSFAYHRPSSVNEAVGLLAQLGEDARAVAGGHSLIPMMKLRLAEPERTGRSRRDGRAQGHARGRRRDRHRRHDHPARADRLRPAGKKLPILRETALQIADPQVRYMGTVGGNVANGDPGNDMPAVMMCLGATYQSPARAASARSPRASSTRAPISPRWSRARSSPRCAFRCRRPATARLTRSSSARSATTPPRPPP